ncbi:hypothetical protein AVEN_156143-1 [Araneus ventricosus]|uniref:F-box domain-containing protein n=1 Tax=Araneus ventricosus TaxID=182803 RepID=A0A4Y2J0Q0_ARAVE|nr:hypothetical protein AVEN_156143-1 [Araneus ventricosus]
MSFPEGYNLADLEDGNANIIIENRDSNSSNSTENLYSSISSDTYQQRNSIQLITIDSDDDDEQILDNEINWAELPSPAVENIYSFLSRTDQSRMSQVCSRWSNDFNSPRLWKTMKFYLPEYDYSSEIYPEVRFALKYAPMFLHVEIICKTVRSHLTSVIWKQLTFFLKAMASSSQLTSIKFIDMGKYFHRVDYIIYADILKIIISFFNSQKNLKTVVFQDSHFSKEEGMELLKAILSDSTTVRNLTLRGFVYEATSTVLSRQYTLNLTEVCCRITNVQSLEVEYTQIFEDVINNLFEMLSSGNYQLDKKKSSMTTLIIYSEDKAQTGFRGILPGTWKYLTNAFPDLKVKMDVTIHSHLTNEMEKFLVREMPLQTLDFRFRKLSPRIDISSLLTYLQLCKYQNHLEVLNILWLPSIADFAGSVHSFVQSCNKIKTLHLHAERTPAGIENVLKAFLENHPMSLNSITLWFNNLQEGEGVDNLTALSEKYYALFKSQGIECFLVLERSPRQRRRETNVIAP